MKPMRPLPAILLFTLAVLLGGALLAPGLYWLAQHLLPGSRLAANPFHRYVDRSLLIVALLGIRALLGQLGAVGWRAVGWVPGRGQGRRFVAGVGLGLISLAVVAVAVVAAHAREWHPPAPGELALKLLGAALTAIVVAAVEETLFRGAVFGALRRGGDWRVAAVVSSVVYAFVHFFQKSEWIGPVTWSAGLELLPRMMRGFVDGPVLVPGFFSLTLAGLLLALAFQRTGNLWFSFGLHSGWIFWLKTYGLLTRAVPGANRPWFGTEKMVDGWLALLVLGMAGAILLTVWRSPAPPPEAK